MSSPSAGAAGLSIDGQPLVRSVHEFVYFPYERINKDSFMSAFLPPLVPICAVLGYLAVKFWLKRACTIFKIDPHALWITRLAIVHDLLLSVYSAWTCYHSCTIVWAHMLKFGFYHTYCGIDSVLWRDLGFWVNHFYLSKYWEFLDTVILILKGKTPSFLQSYHHAGMVLAMWAVVVTQEANAFWVICLNSSIHTVMYTYYTASALGYKWRGKSLLTQAQIFQFFTGICGSLYVHVLGDACSNAAQRTTLLFMQCYSGALIPLFVGFYLKAYGVKACESSVMASPSKAG